MWSEREREPAISSDKMSGHRTRGEGEDQLSQGSQNRGETMQQLKDFVVAVRGTPNIGCKTASARVQAGPGKVVFHF